ncbi:MAG TPA: hypothetical protein VGC65_11150 [Bacteroidia bacterium]
MKNNFFLLILLFIFSCKEEVVEQEIRCCEPLIVNRQIEEVALEAYQVTCEETKLIRNLRECGDTLALNEIFKHKQFLEKYIIRTLFDRQSDLLLAVGETNRRTIADTLNYIKSTCEIVNCSKFIANGFGKVLEADLNHYEKQLQHDSAFQHFGNGLETDLKKYWKKNYHEGMTLGQTLILIRKIQIIVYRNTQKLESNAFYNCLSNQ